MLTLSKSSDNNRIAVPHEDEGQPVGAVSVSILSSGGTALVSGAAATKVELGTALTSSASAGDTSLTVESFAHTLITVGDPIYIVDAEGRSEVILATGKTATSITLDSPLSRAYPDGATVESALVYYEPDISDADTYPVGIYYQAVFTCDSWYRPRAVIFRIVDVATRCPVTFDHVRAWLPHAGVIRDSHDAANLGSARERAWAILEAKVAAVGRDPRVWRDASEAASAGGLLAAGIFLLQHGQPELAKDYCGDPIGSGGLFAGYWDDLMRVPAWFDEDQDRAVDKTERLQPRTTYVRRGL